MQRRSVPLISRMLSSRCGRRRGGESPPVREGLEARFIVTNCLSACRYHEMLFMIDTCQANTMYSKFYSPNIIATGSSEIDQSSYSHHADNDVGVAFIDRYTYYNLDFLESHVKDTNSKMTLGNRFGSYDESKIHSHPGVRYDLFPGGEAAGRER